MNKKHPYSRLQNDSVWRTLEKGIRALVKNGDLEEKTARSHIVGYLTSLLHEAQTAAASNGSKRRIIRIQRDEEVIVRSVA